MRKERARQIGQWRVPVVLTSEERRWRFSVAVPTRFAKLVKVDPSLRVQLKTDSLNERSRNAIRRLGALEEGPSGMTW